jgi:hypothetical protein
MWVKRNHEGAEKNDCLRCCPSRIFFNLRFTDEDEAKCRVQKVHPKEKFNLNLHICLKIGNKEL